MPQTVPTVAARVLLRTLGREGLDSEAMLRDAGLRLAQVQDPDARVAADHMDALWSGALQAAGAGLAWRAAQDTTLDDYRVITYLGRHQPTLGLALQAVGRWFALVDERLVWRVEDRDAAGLHVSLHVPGLARLHRPAWAYSLATTVRLLRLATSLHWRPQYVWAPFAQSDDLPDHAAFFGCPVHYDDERSGFVLQAHDARMPIPGADPALRSMLIDYAQRLADALPPQDDETLLQTLIAQALPRGGASLPHLARALGRSERSLQRDLAERGDTLRDAVDRTRRQLALAHLSTPNLQLAEIAWLLGFSDPRSFTRAFKRWTGVTPSA